MLSLASQKDILGYELDPQVAVSVHFVQGDLEWLMHTEEVPLKDRLFHLFLFYMFTGEPEVKLAVCERVISAQVLHPEDQLELDILTILDLFILAGEPERALDRLVRSYQVISETEYENFVPVTMITELFAQLAAGAGNEVLMQIDQAIVKALQEKPFLRETGSYNIVKGSGSCGIISLLKQKRCWMKGLMCWNGRDSFRCACTAFTGSVIIAACTCLHTRCTVNMNAGLLL